MKLTEARRKFTELRSDRSRVEVRTRHVVGDHPERKFTYQEVVYLVTSVPGQLKDNHVDNPAPDSFVWWCKDAKDNQCQLCVQFKEREDGEVIMVISAFR